MVRPAPQRAPIVAVVLVWINGAFGAGKTTTARHLVAARPGLRSFDPEWVGALLTAHLPDRAVDDFQDLAAWRRLVPTVARELADLGGDTLVAVQTVLDPAYWAELADGMHRAGLDPFHVVLDADRDTLTARIRGDAEERPAQRWRLDHLPVYESARPWLLAAADLVVDTTALTAEAAAGRIAAALDAR